MRIYIVGVCGTFMGGLASIAAELGYRVGGCDAAAYPPMSDRLERSGIEFDPDYLPEHAGGWDRFVIGNAVSRGNPLVEEILRRRAPFASGPEWLAREVLHERRVLAVAGTHGKTTTTAMLAWILDCAGFSPGFLVGGVPADFGVSARLGSAKSAHFVIEADEYDTAFFDKRPKFIHYRPDVLVLNNLEFDHADIYDSLDAIRKQFHFLLRTVPGDGVVLYRAGDAALREAIGMGVWTPCESFDVGGDPGAAEWVAATLDDGFRVFHKGREQGECRWSVLGAHNVGNALGAVAAAYHVGVDVETALRALAEFRGVSRRLEVKGEALGAVIYDDFAHHPSAIRATLEAIAPTVEGGNGRLIAVFEPRSNTMKLGCHNRELTQAFDAADRVFCRRPAELAAALDAAIAGIPSLASPPFDADDGDDALLARLSDETRPGDRIVFMSNGSFGGLPARFVQALQSGRHSRPCLREDGLRRGPNPG